MESVRRRGVGLLAAAPALFVSPAPFFPRRESALLCSSFCVFKKLQVLCAYEGGKPYQITAGACVGKKRPGVRVRKKCLGGKVCRVVVVVRRVLCCCAGFDRGGENQNQKKANHKSWKEGYEKKKEEKDISSIHLSQGATVTAPVAGTTSTLGARGAVAHRQASGQSPANACSRLLAQRLAHICRFLGVSTL